MAGTVASGTAAPMATIRAPLRANAPRIGLRGTSSPGGIGPGRPSMGDGNSKPVRFICVSGAPTIGRELHKRARI
jgi:hypothetical protein